MKRKRGNGAWPRKSTAKCEKIEKGMGFGDILI
jgi:hypothetical protein